jgi:DNA replicative helicase MCM subunit Mcm2 (Cdc46/Mcm family)
MGQKEAEPVVLNPKKPKETLIDEYSYLLTGGTLDSYKQHKKDGNLAQIFEKKERSSGDGKDIEKLLREMEQLKISESEAREELIMMQNLIRK